MNLPKNVHANPIHKIQVSVRGFRLTPADTICLNHVRDELRVVSPSAEFRGGEEFDALFNI